MIARILCALLLVLPLGGILRAEDKAAQKKDAEKPAASKPVEKKAPAKTPSVEIGFQQRSRFESLDNSADYRADLDDQKDYFRYRNRVWAKINVNPHITFHVGLANEFRNYTHPDNMVFNTDETFFEAANVEFKDLGLKGLSLKVGRQDIVKGEGFLIQEGTPGEGSRSFYFNAADLSYTTGKNTFETIWILDPHKDRMLPIIHDKNKNIIDWDEKAIVCYYTGKNVIKDTDLDAYYIYKVESNCVLATTNPLYQPERRIHTAGGRYSRKLPEGFSVTTEFAYQWGKQHPSTDISAWGGYAYIKKAFNHPWKPVLKLGYVGMSGDDPLTKNSNEAWDPLFSRYPKYSELYIFSYTKEKALAYYQNTGIIQAEVVFQPHKAVNARFTYQNLRSYQPVPGAASVYTGRGRCRGNDYQVRVDGNLGKGLTAAVVYEYLKPGDVYKGDDRGSFLRFELMYSFKHIFTF